MFDPVEATGEDAPLLHPRVSVSENDAAYFGIRPVEGTNICHRFRIRHGDVPSSDSAQPPSSWSRRSALHRPPTSPWSRTPPSRASTRRVDWR